MPGMAVIPAMPAVAAVAVVAAVPVVREAGAMRAVTAPAGFVGTGLHLSSSFCFFGFATAAGCMSSAWAC